MNLLVHTTVVSLLLAILARVVVAQRRNGSALRSLAWVFWGLLSFFLPVWIGRVEAILNPLPDVDLLAWVRHWIFVPELVLVYGLTLFWRTLRSKKAPG